MGGWGGGGFAVFGADAGLERFVEVGLKLSSDNLARGFWTEGGVGDGPVVVGGVRVESRFF